MTLKREHLLLYAVTDRHAIGTRDFDAAIEAALQGGVTCLQLREKHMDEAELVKEAKRLVNICHAYGVPLIVNDNWRAALAAGADGVHVGAEDTAAAEIRKAAGSDFIIGTTAKTPAQAIAAQEGGSDYLGVGAVFPSPTKTDAKRITTAQLSEICRSVTIPAVAIGGIQAENMQELYGGGMAGIAVVSAIFAAADIRSAAQNLKQKMLEMI
ncbi:MAG: thiamine phosphate synthase [Oscillospiraceae bacterium]|nr:thiamine phosphate synthase [Oscillospiraceae bacterium]